MILPTLLRKVNWPLVFAEAARGTGLSRTGGPARTGRVNAGIFVAWKPIDPVPFLKMLCQNHALSFIVRRAWHCKFAPQRSEKHENLARVFRRPWKRILFEAGKANRSEERRVGKEGRSRREM